VGRVWLNGSALLAPCGMGARQILGSKQSHNDRIAGRNVRGPMAAFAGNLDLRSSSCVQSNDVRLATEQPNEAMLCH